MRFVRAYVERAEGEPKGEPGDPIRFVAATSGVKDDGIDLMMDGYEPARFESNGAILWAHDHRQPPIGVGEATVAGEKLMVDVRFDQGDTFAREIERKYRDGFMRAVSVGFNVLEWEGKGSYWSGGRAKRWELQELSAVPVGLDADALVDSGRALEQLVGVRFRDELRAGAVLSARNRTLLEQARDAIDDVLAAASKKGDGDGDHNAPPAGEREVTAVQREELVSLLTL